MTLGANIVEKHFTSSKQWKGPDIPISIDKKQLKELKIYSNDIFNSINNKVNEARMRKFEKKTIDFAYSSVVTIKKIKKGELLTKKNIWVKRPGLGDFLAKDFYKLLGKKAKKAIDKDKYLRKQDLL